ncbi:MAG: hypothetical protein WKF64_12130, partial [Ilumatobacteraceae bacterium]
MERDPFAQLELPRGVVDLGRQLGGQSRRQLALRSPGEQRLVDVVVDGPFAAVVDQLRVEAGRLGAEGDRDLGALDGLAASGACAGTAGAGRRLLYDVGIA